MDSKSPEEKYYWVNKASERHKARMLSLAPSEQLQGDLLGVPAPNYMMYRFASIDSPDGKRRYEFLIEYNIYNPSHGIYFGCKSITLPGHHHPTEIKNAISDWIKARPHILQRLNNVFPDKDFTHRFKDTDNDNDNTFWPFWITLYEDEDAREVGARALQIIYGVYRQLIDGTLPDFTAPADFAEKQLTVRTAFTEEAFDRLQNTVERNIRYRALSSSPTTIDKEGWKMFVKFLQLAVKEGVMHRMDCYEEAWNLDTQYSDVDFTCMIQTLFSHISASLAIEPIRIPWNDLVSIFLRCNGTSYKLQVKTLRPVPATKKRWRLLIARLLK